MSNIIIVGIFKWCGLVGWFMLQIKLGVVTEGKCGRPVVHGTHGTRGWFMVHIKLGVVTGVVTEG